MHCHHHPTCPGCPLLDLPYEAQLERKRERLAHALAAFPHLPAAPPVRAAVREEGYRHRLKLPVQITPEGARVGLYAPETGEVLDTPDCPVLEPRLREGLGVVRGWLGDHPEVHAIDMRVSDATGDLQLVLAADGGSLKGGRRGVERLRAVLPALKSVHVSTADPARKRVLGRRPALLSGEPHLTERIGSTEYRLHAGAFFQADPQNAAVLHEIVRGRVGAAATLLDLYAGVGAYGLALAEGRKRVILVEELPQAAEAARAVAPEHVDVVACRVEELDLDQPFEVVLLNPARRGSDPHVIARIAQIAKRVLYVSCGPETLARDLDVFAAHGLHVKHIDAIDLFPQTAEVETIVHLVRREPRLSWPVPGGRAGGPWTGKPSGAMGRPELALALVLHDPGPGGRVPGGRWERIGLAAGHALVRLYLDGPMGLALSALAKQGHPTAGRDARTAPFFADKAGLVRPFEHVLAAGSAFVPLHGDLVLALEALGAPPWMLIEAARPPVRNTHPTGRVDERGPRRGPDARGPGQGRGGPPGRGGPGRGRGPR
jgi:23S rRNA (uracil1939-C5)-methyltransferase